MKPYFEEDGITIYHGDCREVLPQLEAESVNCCVTSPPYWGLRDYGNENQIGLEQTPELYVTEMQSIFLEVRRTLRDDGTLFLNIGDCYHNGDKGGYAKDRVKAEDSMQRSNLGANFIGAPNRQPHPFLKPKDLIGVPWMVAFGLRTSGWWLRADNVWAKPNCMPESTLDRTTRSHEYVFHLTKSERYWYDAEAVRTAPKASTATRLKQDLENQAGSLRANGGTKTNGTMKAVARSSDKQRGHSRRHNGFNDRWDAMDTAEQMEDGGNLRSVWWISPAQFEDEHFAVMPERVAQICTLAGCPNGGVLLDPFAGVGTSLLVARNNQAKGIGIEIEEKYCEIAAKRLAQKVFEFT